MVWRTTAPDGTQSVRANKTILQDNTDYITTNMALDHFWNAGGVTDGHHKHVELVDKAVAPTLDAGMNGMLYAFANANSKPYYINGVGAGTIMEILGIRACAAFSYAAAAAQPLIYSYNVASVTRTATGKYTVTYTNALPNKNYLILGTAARKVAAVPFDRGIQFCVQANTAIGNVKVEGSCKISMHTHTGDITNDYLEGYILCFGG